jgi:hypothetical protein
LIESVRDILVQEVMSIEGSDFEGVAVDMDNIAFASKLWDTLRLYENRLSESLCPNIDITK